MRVGLFVTCLVDALRPSIGISALRLLEAAGCEVIVPRRQTCCGQPGWNSGERSSARSLAKKLIEEFDGCDCVVAPSGSCTGMIRAHYPAVLEGEPEWQARAAALGKRSYELTDFLTTIVPLKQVPGRFEGAVTYHDSCAGLRELAVKRQPRALLALVPGLRLLEMDEAEVCCGFGGTFSVKLGDVSAAMAENKCRAIRGTEADAVVLGDLGCMLNIEGRLRKEGDTRTQVLHIAEVLSGVRGG